MKLRVVFLLLIILPGLLFLFFYKAERSPGAIRSQEQVQVLSSQGRSLTLAFTPQTWSVQTQTIAGEDVVHMVFPGAVSGDSAGVPDIPYAQVVLGMPVDSRVSVQIMESDFETLGSTKLAPVPTAKLVDGWPENRYVFDPKIYRSAAPFPAQLVQVDEPGFLRDQQVVSLRVAGLQYLPQKKEVRRVKRLVLRVDFIGGQIETSRSSAGYSENEEAWYRHTLANYEQARPWRQVREKTSRLIQGSETSLAASSFYQFRISEEGMYRIDGRFIEENFPDLNLSDIDPARIRLFNNGGRELPRDIGAARPQGLVENAIFVDDGGDGRFDRDDFILFYGIGVQGWEYDPATRRFSHYINHYVRDNVYWLSFDSNQPGKRMEMVTGSPAGQEVRTYQGLAFVEDELLNPLKSGLNWFGRQFDLSSRTQTYTLLLPNALPDTPAELRFRFIAKTQGLHRFSVSVNDNLVGTRQVSGPFPDFGEFLALRAFPVTFTLNNQLKPGSNQVQILYSHSASFGQALLDWIELLYPAELNAVDDELAFTVLPDSGLKTYRVDGFSASPLVFDVTDFAEVKEVTGGVFQGGSLRFAAFQTPARPARYIALTLDKFKTPEAVERVQFTDLRGPDHGAEYVIITHEDFYSDALRLEGLRENLSPKNRLSTEVVKIDDIYDNFSGGLMDAVAIRDFLKWAYDHWNPRPLYVLLFGDGDYDYKNLVSKSDKNWIPPFQTDELATSTELRQLVSRATDSWYTYLIGSDRIMDLAIGRINAQTPEEAKNAVDKVIAYETQPFRGNWRNTITIVGDDELVTGGRPSAADNLHIEQAEMIAEFHTPKHFDVKKIYLTEFPKVASASASGIVKPAAKEALLRQMNQGTLIVNYIGHGNSGQWAHEQIFLKSDDDRVLNFDTPIFFVAATCDWALFDDPTEESQAEELMLVERRGAIAMLSSTRLVFSTQNFQFNATYYDKLFASPGPTARIGDAFVEARTTFGSRNVVNNEKFHIYGDPTLRLASPEAQAVITSMTPDSILALATTHVQGEIRVNGQIATDFNGTALVNTFDSRKFVQYIPEAGTARPYFLPGNSIYRGNVPVKNGRFVATFVVPKDISYGGKQARVSVYFWNDETDGAGFRNDIKVSSSTSNLVDTRGPAVRLFFAGHENFTTGDIVNEDVTLVVEVSDSTSGVNIAGEIGHQLTLSIDPDRTTCLSELNRFQGITTIDLTDLFRFDEGSHVRGRVEFPLRFPREVDIGGRKVQCVDENGEDRHTLVVKAWDNANNSSTASVEVLVAHEEGLVIDRVMNYPNPFSNKTTFTFITNQDLESVRIKIFTVSGQLIRTLEYPFATSGFNMIEWDGRDAQGDVPSNGVYLYKLIARAQGSSGPLQKEVVGRLAIIR